jgi:UDP-N-acetylglucosamine:LPS N-acetylglucosamine transferase
VAYLLTTITRKARDHDTVPSNHSVRPALALAASAGGHMAELLAVRAAFEDRPRVWVTGASRQADALREADEDVRELPSWGRDPPGVRGLGPNLRAARRVLRSAPPAVVVTTGAGTVVPYALMARAAGSELLFMETMARVSGASLTGRIVAPLARAVLVQWPEMRAVYRHAAACRPALLEAGARSAKPGGEGTFVSVGTRPEPFDRLLATVDRAVTAGVLPTPVVAQAGTSTYRPASYSASASMAPNEIEQALARARYVVCHGGAAMVSDAIAAGHRPLVLARRRGAGEHRTEHQRQLVERLAREHVVVAVEGEIDADAVRLADTAGARTAARDGLPSAEATLRSELARLLG